MNREIILSLYKSKLKIARNLGYKYGKWNDLIIIHNYNKTVFKYIKRKRRHKFGDIIMNNVRYWYKINKYETDNILINRYIDYGFYILKKLNYLLHR